MWKLINVLWWWHVAPHEDPLDSPPASKSPLEKEPLAAIATCTGIASRYSGIWVWPIGYLGWGWWIWYLGRSKWWCLSDSSSMVSMIYILKSLKLVVKNCDETRENEIWKMKFQGVLSIHVRKTLGAWDLKPTMWVIQTTCRNGWIGKGRGNKESKVGGF